MTTPTGPLTIVATDAGVVRAAGFTADVDELLALVHPSLRGQPRPRADLGPISAAVTSYLDGDLTALDAVPVEQRSGGTFLGPAWEALRTVKPGEPVTYREFAELVGNPTAIRAAAQACARNAIVPFVPCHRVLRTDGTLGGYRYGLEVKKWLLGHESR
ncbi:methylated-DNA--[protein]-cysteine S-methyltransferase [Asanoa sp. WMMD1127]|uniref:methylated-DNA--[protein]-cysteine S-methyltransferase n=1 Tax=Asanoa sp. WMMD1127 TaxID=3016107 RepID=UPI0024177E4B|nr:methylated-DNA--[protein]-cysteine S-methyltransferase [Asanoa sp. WMMD1127]MDG4822881.1 methylated-DNA--[protein]-cysteine S-methyltransferase [Asanoa sp. WMMD1127]